MPNFLNFLFPAITSSRRVMEEKINLREKRELDFIRRVSAVEPQRGLTAFVAFVSFVVSAYGLLPVMPATAIGQSMAIGVSAVVAVVSYVATISSMGLVRYYGWCWRTAFGLLFIWAAATPIIYNGSTTWYISAISGQTTQRVDYVTQMNDLGEAVNKAITAARSDAALLPVVTLLKKTWTERQKQELENGFLTGSPDAGQVSKALGSIATSLAITEASLTGFLDAQEERITAVSNQLITAKRALDLNDPAFQTLQREVQTLRTMVSELQSSRPTLALQQAINSLDEITPTPPSNNAAFASRQADAINTVIGWVNTDKVRLQTSFNIVNNRAEELIPALAQRGNIERINLHREEIRMQEFMAIGNDFGFPAILILHGLFMRRVLVKEPLQKPTPVQTAQQLPLPLSEQAVKPVRKAKPLFKPLFQRLKEWRAERNGKQPEQSSVTPERVEPKVDIVAAAPKKAAKPVVLTEADKAKVEAKAQADFAAGAEKYASLKKFKGFRAKPQTGGKWAAVMAAYDAAWQAATQASKKLAAKKTAAKKPVAVTAPVGKLQPSARPNGAGSGLTAGASASL